MSITQQLGWEREPAVKEWPRPSPFTGFHGLRLRVTGSDSDFPGHVQAARCPQLPSLSPPALCISILRGAAGFTIVVAHLCSHHRPSPHWHWPLPFALVDLQGSLPDASVPGDTEVGVLMGPLDCSKEEKPFFSVLPGGSLRQARGPAWESSGLAVTWFLSFL